MPLRGRTSRKVEAEAKIMGESTADVEPGAGPRAARHDYVYCPKTIAYAVLGTRDYIAIPSGHFNALTFEICGTVTATSGDDAGAGARDMIAQIQIVSRKYGLLALLSGSSAWLSSVGFYGDNCTYQLDSGADGGASAITFRLPMSSTADDSVTVNITWAVIATWHSTATAFDGVLEITPDYIPIPPSEINYVKEFDIGVVDIGGAFTRVPDILDIEGAELYAIGVEAYHTAVDPNTVQSFARYRVQHNRMDRLDVSFETQRCIEGAENYTDHTAAPLAGYDHLRFKPFPNTTATTVTFTNGATATVAGTQGTYWYQLRLAYDTDSGMYEPVGS